MEQITDTICAISTPHGVGGIAVARVSGPDCIAIVDKIWKGKRLADVQSHTCHYGTVSDKNGETLDQGVATVFKAPKSYTGEDTVEISVHGSKFIQRELLTSLCDAGCRMALPGEFTRRAFTNGRLDLAQAEAVADLISSQSRAANRMAVSQMQGGFSSSINRLRDDLVNISALIELELDFSEEDVEFADRTHLKDLLCEIRKKLYAMKQTASTGRAIKEGVKVVIAGATNVGKSSLLNQLLCDDRAIVSDTHGTTRDTIEETVEIGDYIFRFVDTAGLRDTADTVEQIGIERSRKAIESAMIILAVVDGTSKSADTDLQQLMGELSYPKEETKLIVVANKSDLDDYKPFTADTPNPVVKLSAKSGDGMEQLRRELVKAVEKDIDLTSDVIVTNVRHAQILEEALQSTEEALTALNSGISLDIVAEHLRQTIRDLSSLTGQIPSTEILQTIFSRFCIGK